MLRKRQQLLFLYLGNSAPDSSAIGWSIYDGTGKEKPPTAVDSPPPYDSVLAAMLDGWRVIQVPTLKPDLQGQEYHTDYLTFEYVLERLEDCDE